MSPREAAEHCGVETRCSDGDHQGASVIAHVSAAWDAVSRRLFL